MRGDAANESELSRLVPFFRRDMLRRHAGATLPAVELRDAVILHIDIVGFTSTTDGLVREGVFAAESVAEGVNRILSAIAAIAGRHGGEVSHFAGDAAWIVWLSPQQADLTQHCHSAARTAIEVRQQARNWRFGGGPVRLRTSIGCGPVQYCEVGGHEGQWIGLLLGTALNDTVEADQRARPGEIVVSPTAWALLGEAGDGLLIDGGYVQLANVRAGTVVPLARAVEATPDDQFGAMIPPTVRLRAEEGPLDEWRGEFRTASVVFGRLQFASVSGSDVEQLHGAIIEAQRCVQRYGGVLYQALVDEQGLALIAVFGLPRSTHPDDPSRAIDLAVALRAGLSSTNLSAHFGVATGRLFCTIYAADARLEFAVVGPAINRAARLADGRGELVADEETVRASELQNRLVARHLPPQVLRGIAQPVSAYEIFERIERQAGARAPLESMPTLIGREIELARGRQDLEELEAGRGGLVIIEGDPGVGKSALALAIAFLARQKGLSCLRGEGDDLGRQTEYSPWRRVIREGMAIASEGLQPITPELLAAIGPNRPYAELLGSVLNLAVDAPGAPPVLNAEGRAELVRQMLKDALAAAAMREPLVLLLEDLQWFDSSSLLLLEDLLDAELPILVIATRRLADATASAAPDRLLAGSRRNLVRLSGLTEVASADLLAVAFAASRSDRALASLVHARTGGNPFFVIELGRFLLEHGALAGSNGVLTPRSDDVPLEDTFKTFGVPGTLEGVVMGRFDALPSVDRQVLRVCSVLGRSFASADVAAMLPDLDAVQFDNLVAAGLVLQSEAGTPDRFAFSHAILRDVAYETLAIADRRVLHAAAAQRLAASAVAQAGGLDAVLAHHYEHAGDSELAATYFTRAGQAALRANANKEAFDLLSRAAAMLAKAPVTGEAGDSRSIAVALGLGEAAQRLSRYDEAQRHKDDAVALLGLPIPRGAAIVPALLAEVATQWLHRRMPRVAPRMKLPVAQRLTLSAETAGLVEVYFYLGEALRSLLAAVRALNLAEGTGDTPELARGFAIVGTIAGFAGLSKVAHGYGERALSVLSRIEDPAAAWYVPLVVGVSRLSAGDLNQAAELMDRTARAAEQIHDRRHWRDGIENLGIIAAMRGDWERALDLVSRYRATAVEDHDIRYTVAALREQAYYLLQTGRLDEAASCLDLIQAEFDRGLKAEAAATEQDWHAIAATIALERGSTELARAEAELALAALTRGKGETSFPNMFWPQLLVARVYFNLWQRAEGGGDREGVATAIAGARAAMKALAKHARSHQVGRPAALLVRGLFAVLRGNQKQGMKSCSEALALARKLGLRYEAELATAAISGQDGSVALGLPTFVAVGTP